MGHKFAALILAGVLAAMGGRAALAQVAAPNLTPVGALLPAPGNPAVLAWSKTRVALSYGLVDVNAQGTAVAEGNEATAQAQKVGERFAAGVVASKRKVEYEPLQMKPTENTTDRQATVTWQYDGILSVGAGISRSDKDSSASKDFNQQLIFGATLRLKEVFFVGVARSDETINRRLAGNAEQEAKRPVTRYGLAYRQRMGDWGAHVEGYRSQSDAVVDSGSPAFNQDESTTGGYTLEGVYSNVLAGYTGGTVDTDDAVSGQRTQSVDYGTFVLGWAPVERLAVLASHTARTTRDGLGNETRNETVNAIGAAWQF